MNVAYVHLPKFCKILPKIALYPVNCSRAVSFMPTRYAGHSHWQNVRHTKEAKDKERARLTSYILLQVDTAVKRNYAIFLFWISWRWCKGSET